MVFRWKGYSIKMFKTKYFPYWIALLIVLLGLSGLSSCSLSNPDERRQTKVIRQFYELVIHRPERGLPSREFLKQLAPYVSDQLEDELKQAIAAEERHQKLVEGKEPPLVEGALFFSLFEGADRVKKFVPEGMQNQNAFQVSFEYGDTNKPKELTKWKDRVEMIQEHGQWVINDIEYQAPWPFALKGKLSELLVMVDHFDQK